MTVRQLIRSLMVLFVMAMVTLAIWHPSFFTPLHAFLATNWNWIVTLIIAVVALPCLLFCLCANQSDEDSDPCCCDEIQKCQEDYNQIPSPYPDTYDRKMHPIAAFQYKDDLHLLRLNKRLPQIPPEQQYIVAEDFEVTYELNGNPNSVKVPRGTLTDLSSSPGPFRLFVARVGPHLEASIMHDYLYVAWQVKNIPPTPQMRAFSDDLMRTAMRATGMGCKADLTYWAVRLMGRSVFLRKNSKPLILCETELPSSYHADLSPTDTVVKTQTGCEGEVV